MAKVICALPNASELINGVKFVSHKLGMISEEIEDEVAEQFAKIKGYVLHSKNAAKDLAAQNADSTAQAAAPVSAGQAPAEGEAQSTQSQPTSEGGTAVIVDGQPAQQ